MLKKVLFRQIRKKAVHDNKIKVKLDLNGKFLHTNKKYIQLSRRILFLKSKTNFDLKYENLILGSKILRTTNPVLFIVDF